VIVTLRRACACLSARASLGRELECDARPASGGDRVTGLGDGERLFAVAARALPLPVTVRATVPSQVVCPEHGRVTVSVPERLT
jgi:hypothetical protein